MSDHRFDRTRWAFHEGVLAEFAEEQGHALGRAGERLNEALAEYRRMSEAGPSDSQKVREALTQARDAAWALVVQRECAGFRSRDLNWLREHWQVPDEVIRLI